MQNFSLTLFDNACVLKPKAEQQLLSIVHFSIVINLLLPLYLIYTSNYEVGMLVFLLDLVIVFCCALYTWFNQRPRYRIHFTITLEGVRYRSHVAEQEQAFDWEEVDTVRMLHSELLFTLKNGETHTAALDRVQDADTLHVAKTKIVKIAKKKDFTVL